MKPSTVRIERRRLTDQIIDQFLSMVANGKLKPGDKLPPEPVLMEQFGVGRSSLREAIGALSLVGLFSVRPGHGTTVNVSAGDFLAQPLRWSMLMNWRDRFHELFEARIAIERAMVKMAAERATEEDVAEIRSHHDELRAAKKMGRKAVQADLAFHEALAKASHNSVLARFLAELRQPVRRWLEQKAPIVGDYEIVIEQHEAILRAIEKRDPEKAESALREHLESVGKRLTVALLEGRSKPGIDPDSPALDPQKPTRSL